MIPLHQFDMFEIMHERFKFDKDEIKLIELFSGIGSQATALKQLSSEYGFTLNVLGVSEIDKYAIKSYNAIHGETHNFGNIMDIEELPYTDILTYSFPCQDISLAGKQKGFSKGSGTRSGLLWQVERILERQKEIDKLPQVLLMENVRALASVKFVEDFNQWQLKLQELGYTNYWEILNAKDYGIPQNRERVFMVSILGEYAYNFPKPFPLKLRLKDMLEKDVDVKYYLSDKLLNTFLDKGTGTYPRRERFIQNITRDNQDIANCVTGNPGQRPTDNFLILPEATKKGYTKAKEGDDSIPKVITKGNYSPSNHNASRIVDEQGIAPTVMENHGTVTAVETIIYDDYNSTIRKDQDTIGTITPNFGNDAIRNGTKLIENNLHIRKLTPKECWRLMGFSDDDFYKAEQVCSNSQLYKQAGNSIVVDVLYYIFKELF